MQVQCPACTRALTVADPSTHALVRCPYCSTVIDLSALASAGYGQQAGYPAAHSAATTMDAIQDSAQTSTAKRTQVRRRKKSTQGWGILALAVVLGGGAIWATIAVVKQANQPSGLSQREQMAIAHAQAFVRAYYGASTNVSFPESGFKASQADNGLWLVSGPAHIASAQGVLASEPWQAELRNEIADQWQLERLLINQQLVASGGTRVIDRDFSAEKPDDADDTPQFQSNFGFAIADQGPGEDFYSEQTPVWALNQVADGIQESVKLRKTLVIWLVDQSASAGQHRAELASSFTSIFKDLNRPTRKKAGEEVEPALLNAVVTFGKTTTFVMEEPVSELSKVEGAIQGIAEDSSGSENVFTAIGESLEKYLPFRTDQGRYLMLVVVTDEAGDDESAIDENLALLRKHSIPVTVVGGRAPFGRRSVPSSNPEGSVATFGQTAAANTLHQGPESFASEHINLAFFNPNYGADDTESLDSGFGSFALTRLANESGGAYYACRTEFSAAAQAGQFGASGGFTHSFDPKIMRRYAPDYVSAADYQALLAANKARKALVDAAKLPRAETMKFAKLDFPKTSEAELKNVLDAAQRGAATIEPKVNALYEALKAGDSDRAKLTGLRWQAGYDLAMGRVLAAKVRTEGYNAMLAQLKAGRAFQDPNNNMFVLQTSADSIDAGSVFERMMQQSRTYLERVIKEHPGTPWAFLAERELQVPMGWKWTESRLGGMAAAPK